jgi:hypothetical protein
MIRNDVEGSSQGLILCIVYCFISGQQRSYQGLQMGLMGVVNWWWVGVHLLGTSVWQGQLYLQGTEKTLDQAWRLCRISDLFLA